MRDLKYNLRFITLIIFIAAFQYTNAQEGDVVIEQDSQIPELLEKRVAMSKANDLGERFKIQLYYGDNQRASSVITNFRSRFGEWPSEVVYETPNYKVWVGNFRNKLEADRALMQIKDKFPSAFIFKPERG